MNARPNLFRPISSPLAVINPRPRAFHPPPSRPGAQSSELDGGLLGVVLAEYSAVRQEIQTALSNQQSCLSVGAATLGLLCAAGAQFWPESLVLAGLVFALAVPAACAVAVRMWYGELLRIARGARFVAQLEDWINAGAPTMLMSWERWMHECRQLSGQDHDRSNWRAVQFVFSALAAMSIALGLYWLMRAAGPALAVPIGTLDAILCLRARSQIKRIERRANDYLNLPSADDADRVRASSVPTLGTAQPDVC